VRYEYASVALSISQCTDQIFVIRTRYYMIPAATNNNTHEKHANSKKTKVGKKKKKKKTNVRDQHSYLIIHDLTESVLEMATGKTPDR
jgi:hypothetical protein